MEYEPAATFTIFPAIDLRQGHVVRLKQGDPERQTIYAADPAATARRWLDTGADWLHVVNLDGAFGMADTPNRAALHEIVSIASEREANIQFGGGLRSIAAIEQALELGVQRVVLGTILVEQPELLEQALNDFGPERVAAGIDAQDGMVRVRGWEVEAGISAHDLAQRLANQGLRRIIFTDVTRDGMGAGLNLPATQAIASIPGLQVIASGGVDSPDDIRQARQAGLAGVIVGRALYDGKVQLSQVLAEIQTRK